VVLCARCWWPTRTTFISNTCSTRFKPFHPLINLSLTHGALSIVSQHTTLNFHRFHSFCPKKPHYATLFFDGLILQRRAHVSALVAATWLKAECCTAHGWTLQQALSILRNVPAPLSFPVTAWLQNFLYFLIHPRTCNLITITWARADEWDLIDLLEEERREPVGMRLASYSNPCFMPSLLSCCLPIYATS